LSFSTPPINDLPTLLRSMQPVLNDGCFVFTTIAHESSIPLEKVVAMIREREGISLVLREGDAIAAQLPIHFRAAWITLNVHSDLQAVGLTAAFAKALAHAGLSCNVVAGTFHDHIFVPFDSAARAMRALVSLSSSAE
jgi:uncharacterized protein